MPEVRIDADESWNFKRQPTGCRGGLSILSDSHQNQKNTVNSQKEEKKGKRKQRDQDKDSLQATVLQLVNLASHHL